MVITHSNKHFHLYFEYDTLTAINRTLQKYINVLLLQEYEFNISVYEISSNNIGDKCIIFDPNLNLPFKYVCLFVFYFIIAIQFW